MYRRNKVFSFFAATQSLKFTNHSRDIHAYSRNAVGTNEFIQSKELRSQGAAPYQCRTATALLSSSSSLEQIFMVVIHVT